VSVQNLVIFSSMLLASFTGNKLATPLGNDDQMWIIGRDDWIGGSFVSSTKIVVADGETGSTLAGLLEIAMVDLMGTKSAPDRAKVTTDNVIWVEMQDLSEKDHNDLELELQRDMDKVMAERRRKKLACFQKTRSGVIKKGDTVKASTLVNSPFTLEELIHMIDISVTSKYGSDLEAITRTLIDCVK
jgi:hypothetical protein